jgi:hypothetical protein
VTDDVPFVAAAGRHQEPCRPFTCWHIQEQAFGGLDPATAKVLDGFARQQGAGPAPQGRRAENRGAGWHAALNAHALMQKGQFNLSCIAQPFWQSSI